MKKIATHYTGYVLQNKPGQRIHGIHPSIQLDSDSSFNSLIDYASRTALRPIYPEDINPLSNQHVDVQLSNGLRGNLADDELGYIVVSPVITNGQTNQAVFFYELLGDGHSSWIVCLRRMQNRWIIVN
ncbi:hypothetical protein [Spirosoma sp. KNUC1025]|uniref:hypothetical protein n=1 Tax=Spirosoma sp. KNUC1025 TaxID=2894082 RepID=UPI003868AA7A|nr:hypothetical protein LN737_08345 [Spirosoma sp. KNUC1025]